MKTISFVNPLGGSGKSTSVWSLGSGLHQKSYRVLLIDVDEIGMLAYLAGIGSEEPVFNLYDVLSGNTDIESAIYSLKPGLDIITGSMELFRADVKLTQLGREYMLKEQLERIKSKYDYCIIDTAHAWDILLTNALTASDSVIIPMPDEEWALNVMGYIRNFIDTVIISYNPKLEIRGFLVISAVYKTTFASTALSQMEKLAEQIGTKVFRTKIRSMNRAEELAVCDYRNFVDEFLEQ